MGHKPKSINKEKEYPVLLINAGTTYGAIASALERDLGRVHLHDIFMVKVIDTCTLRVESGKIIDNKIMAIDNFDTKTLPVSHIKNIDKVSGELYFNTRYNFKDSYVTKELIEKMQGYFGIKRENLKSIKFIGGKQAKNALAKYRLLGYNLLSTKEYSKAIDISMVFSDVIIGASNNEIVILADKYIKMNASVFQVLYRIMLSKCTVTLNGVNLSMIKDKVNLFGTYNIINKVKTPHLKALTMEENNCVELDLRKLDTHNISGLAITRCRINRLDISALTENKNFKTHISISHCNIETLVLGDYYDTKEMRRFIDRCKTNNRIAKIEGHAKQPRTVKPTTTT